MKLAGVAVGDPVSDDAVSATEQRLKASGKFETIEVRKRYRSIDDPTGRGDRPIVHEHPGATAGGPPIPVLNRLTHNLMFLPILAYEDGYGFSYGGRITIVDALGTGGRLSSPLTWGGTKQATREFERVFKTGPLTRVQSSFGISNRENPHFEIDAQRLAFTAGHPDGEIERLADLVREQVHA